MRGVVFPGDGRVEVREFPDPEPGPGEVVVRMKASGLCGTDLRLMRLPAGARNADIIVGHEPCGIVERVGHGVRAVKPGDRVSVYHYRGCGLCEQCRMGNIMFCVARRGYGGPIHGSHADLILTDERNCLALPEELSFAEGAIIACGAGTAFSALRKLQLNGEQTLVISGQGPVGLNGLLLAKAMGGRVIALEPVAERRELSARLGADHVVDPSTEDVPAAVRELTGGRGADLGFETSGKGDARRTLSRCLRNGGRAAFVGFGHVEGGDDLISAVSSDLIARELTLVGSYVMPIYMYPALVRLLLGRAVRLESMITHRFPIERAPEAFELFATGRCGKVMFEWQ